MKASPPAAGAPPPALKETPLALNATPPAANPPPLSKSGAPPAAGQTPLAADQTPLFTGDAPISRKTGHFGHCINLVGRNLVGRASSRAEQPIEFTARPTSCDQNDTIPHFALN
jgi:hypothetical protein